MSKRFEVGLGLHTGYLPLQASLELSKQGEEVGFDSMWVPEALGSIDTVSVLGALTRVTRRPTLGSVVAGVYTKNPPITAVTF